MTTPAELLGRCTFPPRHTSVVCGLSGGADSTALVILAVAAGCRTSAIHVHHGLRPSADDDAACAQRSADRLGIALQIAEVALDDGPNLEARAREARRAVLGRDALLGHTAEDQAETLLLGLLRGSGATGLAAIRPGPQHPILRLRASETRSLCSSEGFDVATDPTNSDPRFRRNRIRHELVPLLDDIAERDVTPLLARSADLLRADDDHLAVLAAALDPTDAAALASAPPPIAARAVRRWLEIEGYPPDAAAVARVLAVASGHIAACEISGGRRIERRHGQLHLFSQTPTTG